ncbi:MAG: preprotein translocase subunit SecA [Deltaproteobacteria bacterium]|nr:preprotein translocase subunit SecA [Deltaproteobacteria bacterium]
MFAWIMKKILGTKNERELKKLRPLVTAINDLEPSMKELSDQALRGKTAELKTKLDNGAKLDDVLVPAFAACREAGRRVLSMRHFDVQLIGGMVLHSGKIAEMKTGEGKTLVATLPCYLNALEGKGVHVVTVNDYLARRDSEWMGKIYNFLGLSVGTILHSQSKTDKRRAYNSDITYGQNNEYGFDYLRDNMEFSLYGYVQRDLNYAIVDEVDSILVDEARTPLIISGQAERSRDLYVKIDDVLPKLRKEEHYTVDEKHHSAMLTDEGVEEAQRLLSSRGLLQNDNLYDPVNLEVLHILQQSLRAHTLYKRDVNYMVTAEGKVLIIDEHTGRTLPGRRWSDGLHQAVEAKERVPVQEETRTMATISFQNLFRIYKKLAGMTGTAETEAEEFHKIYKLPVMVIPTNVPIARVDSEDVVYKTEREKFNAVVDEILACREQGQPALVGTVSVEKSEAVSKLLTKKGIPHEVLNAKQHEREAYVVAQAGRKGAVTVSTNMAGRGTDIVLGGNPEMLAKYEVTSTASPEVKADPALLEAEIKALTDKYRGECEAERKEVVAAGGLHIIGTERHESRRIDNQLRGRSGRQGDPGSSRFFLSLEDDLMRIFAGEKIQGLMERLGMQEGEPIEHKWVTKAVANAQTKVEARNFDIRKHLLEYDDVMNQQRKSTYKLRRQLLEGRYDPTPTVEEGKEKDAEKIEKVVIKVDPTIEESCLRILDEMIRAFGAEPKPDADPTATYREMIVPESIDKVVNLRVDHLEQEVYNVFGVRCALAGLEKKAAEVRDKLAAVLPQALSEQHERLLDLVDEQIGEIVTQNAPENRSADDWDFAAMERSFEEQFGVKLSGIESCNTREDIARKMFKDAEGVLSRKEKEIGIETILRIFRVLYLEEIDRQWVDFLQAMDHLRDGIGLRGYGSRDPKLEYKKEGFNMFLEMRTSIASNVIGHLYRVQVQSEEDAARLEEDRRKKAERKARQMVFRHDAAPAADQPQGGPHPEDEGEEAAAEEAAMRAAAAQGGRRGRAQAGAAAASAAARGDAPKPATVRRARPKIGANDPCHCGSGKKYKKCHMREDELADAAAGASDDQAPAA